MTDGDRPDRKATSRRRVLKGGKIIFRAGFSVVDCVVRDDSPAGARLKIASVMGIPDVFQL
jgi:hypothetical protein